MGQYLDNHVANLKSGLSRGRTATRDAVQKTIDQLDRLDKSAIESLAVFKPALAERNEWSAADRESFAMSLRAAIQTSLRPGLIRYHDFLVAQILPAARPPEKAGLGSLPGGADAYRKMIRVHTSLDLSARGDPQARARAGRAFRRDLAALGQKVFGTSDVAEIQKRLRTDPAMHFRTAEEVEAKAREALARAKAAMPHWFGMLPEGRLRGQGRWACTRRRNSTIAYYRQPAADGSRPGLLHDQHVQARDAAALRGRGARVPRVRCPATTSRSRSRRS